jgi:hypothetical protein
MGDGAALAVVAAGNESSACQSKGMAEILWKQSGRENSIEQY